MLALRNHFSRSCALVAAVLFCAAIAGGCSLFKAETWNPARYRDERAVDIEERLTKDKPIVENPF